MSRRLALLVALLALPVALDVRAASLVMPLAADTLNRPAMLYAIWADDGASIYFGQARMDAVSGFAEVETSSLSASVRAWEFSYPAANFDLTVREFPGGANQIPFSISINATTERVQSLSSGGFATFGLVGPGLQIAPINSRQIFERVSFGFTLESAGSVFEEVGGGNCESITFGCVSGRLVATTDAVGAITELWLSSGPGAAQSSFALGTDPLGVSWTVSVSTIYPSPVMFAPEPGTAALLGLGLVVLGTRRRRA